MNQKDERCLGHTILLQERNTKIKNMIGYFLDIFMNAALYFCLVFDGVVKSTKMFCEKNFIGFLFVCFPKRGMIPYVVRSQTRLCFFATKFAFNLTALNF